MELQRPDVKSIFSLALEHCAGPDRIAYMHQACGGDADLRAEVERLLDAHERAEGFLGSSAGMAAAATALATAPPDVVPSPSVRPLAEGAGGRIGSYKMLREIGQGGMGAVFIAEQEKPVRRRVALKVIKAGMDTPRWWPASRPSARRWR